MAMMIRLSLLILFVCLGKSTAEPKALRKGIEILDLQHLNNVRSLPVSHFDYFQPKSGFGKSLRRLYQRRTQHSQLKEDPIVTTTERPLIRVWNNILRSVTLPVSTFTLNITNPLANFFNDGTANIIETPPPAAEYEVPIIASSKRRNNNKKRKYGGDTYVSKQNKNYRRKKYDGGIYENYQSADQYTSNSYYGQPYMHLRVNPYMPLYYYDSRTGHYYDVPRPNSYGYYNQPNSYAHDNEDSSYEADDEDSDEDDENVLLTNNAMIGTLDKVKDDGGNAQKPQKIKAVKTNIPIKPTVSPHEVTDEHDDAIEVVENFDDDDSDFRSAKATEELQNSLGTYMRDDLFNRLRQRIPEVRRKPSLDKQKPRQQLRYYLVKT